MQAAFPEREAAAPRRSRAAATVPPVRARTRRGAYLRGVTTHDAHPTGRSWTGRWPGLYDALMAPLERAALDGWRRRLWAGVDAAAGAGLELGAGSGPNRAYRPAGTVVTDLSAAMLAREARREGATARAAADATRLPFRDGAFPWAVATLLYCEVPDPLAALREARRVLLPGGTLHLLEHVRPRGALGALAGAATRATAPLFGEHFDRDTAATARAAGFRVTIERESLRGALVLMRAEKPTDPKPEKRDLR